jgi:oligosaccharide repeat unit polymerase
MMLYAIALTFGLLLLLLYLISRSLLFPAVVFVGMWALTLGVLALLQDSFYPVSLQTLAIYLVGAVAFAAGCVLVLGGTPRFARYEGTEARRNIALTLLDVAFFAAIVGFPFFVRYVTEPIGGVQAPNLLALIRFMNLETAGRSSGFSLMNNLPLLARFVAFGMVLENDGTPGRRWRAYLAAILAILYGLFTGSKAVLISILVVAFFIDAMKKGKLNLRRTVAVAVILLLLFAFGLLLVNYWWLTNYSTLADLAPDVAWTTELYWLSGVVAFDQVVQHPGVMESRQNVGRIFVETANSFGAKLYLPDLNAAFTTVSPRQDVADMNVYTIYFSYFKDPGWWGMIALMLLVGAASTLVYKLALAKWPIALVMYGLVAEAAILSFHGEHYFFGLNQFVKVILFFAVIYHLPGLLAWRAQRALRAA